MKILAFAASNSRASINRQLVESAIALIETELDPSADVATLDINDFEMPLYSIDREKQDGIPDAASRFLRLIADADALLISYAEHNGFYSAAYKNLFDWASRINAKVYQNKPMVIMATSPGGNGGANVLRAAAESAPHFAGVVVGTFSLARFPTAFDQDRKRPLDAEKLGELRVVLSALLQA